MRLTKQIYVTDLAEGWKGIYSPFGHKFAFLDDIIWNHLNNEQYQAVDSKVLNYLTDCNILVDESFEENWRRKNNLGEEINLNSMYLITTQKCNLGCKYCVVIENMNEKSDFNQKMSLETGESAVSFFERHLKRTQPSDPRVTFYGGEPMLNQELIAHLVPKIKAIRYPNQSKPVEIMMITNGYLYNPEITELFKKYDVAVSVSLDGKKEHQDVTRVTRGDSKSTFDTVIQNFRKYQQSGLPVAVSTALGSHNAFYLDEISEFYAKELKPAMVEFQIPYQVSQDSNPLWVSTKDISRHLMRAYNILRAHNIIEGTTYRRLSDMDAGRIHYKDCGACGSQVVVAPDGMVGPCHSLVGSRTFFAGNVNDPDCDVEKLDAFRQWAGRHPLNMSQCSDCAFISLCGGGCTYNSYITTKSIWNKDPQVCEYMQHMVEWILRDIWHSSGMSAKHVMIDRDNIYMEA